MFRWLWRLFWDFKPEAEPLSIRTYEPLQPETSWPLKVGTKLFVKWGGDYIIKSVDLVRNGIPYMRYGYSYHELKQDGRVNGLIGNATWELFDQ